MKQLLFDIIASFGIAGILLVPLDFKGIYFVWFSILLLCLSYGGTRVREVDTKWLSYFLIFCFISVFMHSFSLSKGSICYKYINYYLGSDLFLYAFAGVALFRTLVSYVKRAEFLGIGIAIVAWDVAQGMIRGGQVSLLLALGIAVFIYSFLKKWFTFCWVISIFAVIGVVANHSWIEMKWACRPYVWIELCRCIMQHPFSGSGFNLYLTPDDMVWIREIGGVTYGWLFKHNDYLSMASYIGLPVLLPIGAFIVCTARRLRNSCFFIPCVAFAICSFFQITMFQADKAIIVISLTALAYTKT